MQFRMTLTSNSLELKLKNSLTGTRDPDRSQKLHRRTNNRGQTSTNSQLLLIQELLAPVSIGLEA